MKKKILLAVIIASCLILVLAHFAHAQTTVYITVFVNDPKATIDFSASDGRNAQCLDGCQAPFYAGSTLTITAVPASGSVFSGWQNGLYCHGTNPICTFVVGSNTTENAVFSVARLLTVGKSPDQGVVTSTDGFINCGTTCSKNGYSTNANVTLNSSVNAGYSLTGWSVMGGVTIVSGCASSGGGGCTVSMANTGSVTAYYSVSVAPPTSTKFSVGDSIQTTANVSVRGSPTTSGNLLATKTTGTAGTIAGGPMYANGYFWWQVNFDDGTTGWTVENYLSNSNAETLNDVKVIPTSDSVGANLEQVAANEQVVSSDSCRTPEYIAQYGGLTAYNARLAKEAVCNAGKLSVTILQQKIADLSASVAEINKRLASLATTKTYLAKFSPINLNGLTLVGIPAGQDETKSYPTATNISEMCVKDTTDGTVTPTVAVGTSGNDTVKIFNSLPDIAKQKMQEVRNATTNLKTILGTYVAPGFWKVVGSVASKDVAAGVDSNITKVGQMLGIAMNNQKIASQYFTSITEDDLKTNYPDIYNSKNYMETSLIWHGGKRETKSLTKLTDHMKDIITTYVPREEIPLLTTFMDMTLDDISITKPSILVPEADLYAKIQAAIAGSIAKYGTMKTAYQTDLIKFQGQLDTLVKNGYNCQ